LRYDFLFAKKQKEMPEHEKAHAFPKGQATGFLTESAKKDQNGSNAKKKYSFAPTITRSLVDCCK